MLVKNLKEGMLLAPQGRHDIFLCVPAAPEHGRELPYITVRTKSFTSKIWHGKALAAARQAMYLGTRKSLGISKKQSEWSDRFALFNNEIVAIDPPAWIRIRSLTS